MASPYTQSSLWPSGWTPDVLAAMAKATKGLPDTPDGLLAALSRHQESLRIAAQRQEFLDLILADLLAKTLGRLVVDPGLPPHIQEWVRQAVGYLVSTDDLANDRTDLDGLDDDAEMLLALLDAIGRSDLAIPIRAHLRQ